MSHNSTQRQAGSTENNQQGDKQGRYEGFHYVKHHGYEKEDFAKEGDSPNFIGIRVINESDSEDSVTFEDFKELSNSQWRINGTSGVRLSDGRLLFEGRK